MNNNPRKENLKILAIETSCDPASSRHYVGATQGENR